MSIFGKIIKSAMTIVELPIAAVKDVVTMGGVLEDEPKPYTVQKLNELGDTWKEIKEEAGK